MLRLKRYVERFGDRLDLFFGHTAGRADLLDAGPFPEHPFDRRAPLGGPAIRLRRLADRNVLIAKPLDFRFGDPIGLDDGARFPFFFVDQLVHDAAVSIDEWPLAAPPIYVLGDL